MRVLQIGEAPPPSRGSPCGNGSCESQPCELRCKAVCNVVHRCCRRLQSSRTRRSLPLRSFPKHRSTSPDASRSELVRLRCVEYRLLACRFVPPKASLEDKISKYRYIQCLFCDLQSDLFHHAK